MARSGSSPRLGSASLIVFLLCALAVAGILAYQAQDAARSHREAAEQTLNEYAALATWQFSRQADMALTALQMMALRLPVTLDSAEGDRGLPSVEEFREDTRQRVAWCRCVDDGAVFFRWLRSDGSLHMTDGRAELVDSLAAGFARLEAVPNPEEFAFGRAPIRENKTTAYAFQSRRAAVVFGSSGDDVRVVLYYVVHDAEEQPIAIYGLEAAPERVLGTIFDRILDETPLLPQALTDSLPNEAMLAVTAAVGDQPLFRSADGVISSYRAETRLAEPWEEVAVAVDLRPAVAGDLLIGGLPGSRLPLLLALLGLTAALIVAALVQMQRHQELVRTRTNFVAGVSHELRTPLTQIRLYADLLRSGRLGQKDHERSVRVIDQEARRLSHLVENILRFSTAGSNTVQVNPEPHALAPLVSEIVRDFAPLATARRAAIREELEDDVVAPVDADAFRQILINLLDNAVKYGPAGQEIVIGLERRDGIARLRVDDEGLGIPDEERERVWEAYHRLEGAIASGMGGSGIGLSVVRELAELHGGRVRVSEAPDGGARFVVELPAPRSAPAVEPEMETV